MQVVLLEKVGRLGNIGEVVTVKDGYARNFLLPKNKALRATKNNLAYFEAEKSKLEKLNEDKKKNAEKVLKKIDGKTVAIIRAASEGGQLYGSVSTRDIAEAVSSLGETVARQHVVLNQSFKALGLYPVDIEMHPEVVASVTINIARSEDEAEIQQKEGRALIVDHHTEEEDEVLEVAEDTVKEENTDSAEETKEETKEDA